MPCSFHSVPDLLPPRSPEEGAVGLSQDEGQEGLALSCSQAPKKGDLFLP